MTKRDIAKLAKQFDGWLEGDGREYVARFPTPWQANQFQLALMDAKHREAART